MMRRLLFAAAFVLAALPAGAQLNIPTATGVSTAIAASGSGTTAAVTATLTAAPSKTTFLCGFSVSGTGAGLVTPITITGLVGGSFTYQGISAGTVPFTPPTFWPCLPATGTNVAISVSTTADASATAVNVKAWGLQQ